jgi:hypothetical protein
MLEWCLTRSRMWLSVLIFQHYQGLKVLSQFLTGQFIFHGVRQTLV